MAGKGRKYKILEQSEANLTKQQQEAKFSAEILASDGYKLLQNSPPNRLSGVAKAEWKRIIPDLKNLPVRSVDRAMVEQYCFWYSQFVDLSERLKTVDDIDDRMKILGTLDKVSKNIRSAASEIGLTVDSRMRMNVPKQEDKPKTLADKLGF
ncbi:hypothetical protein CPEBRM1_ABPJDJAI_00887 [Companilactobacillus paralimentarius]|uniref:phage terminase small subunit P27 family n=1 Tax=Companilactobacillus paralimentarius TaxID=83526 RepID=UPI0038512E8F